MNIFSERGILPNLYPTISVDKLIEGDLLMHVRSKSPDKYDPQIYRQINDQIDSCRNEAELTTLLRKIVSIPRNQVEEQKLLSTILLSEKLDKETKIAALKLLLANGFTLNQPTIELPYIKLAEHNFSLGQSPASSAWKKASIEKMTESIQALSRCSRQLSNPEKIQSTTESLLGELAKQGEINDDKKVLELIDQFKADIPESEILRIIRDHNSKFGSNMTEEEHQACMMSHFS